MAVVAGGIELNHPRMILDITAAIPSSIIPVSWGTFRGIRSFESKATIPPKNKDFCGFLAGARGD